MIPECRICNAGVKQQSIRAETVFGGKDKHKFWHCSICNAVYLYPVPSIEDEKRFYAQEFEKFMSTRAGTERDWSNADAHKATNQDQIQRRWPFLEDYVKKGKSVLEVGCSTGFMLDAFRKRGMNCVGIEPSGEFLPYLHKQGYEAYESITELPSGKQFDLVTHFFVFEHIRDPFTFLTEIHRKLNKNGIMVAEIPCVNDPLTSLYKIPAFESFYWSIAHHYYYSPESLSYVMDKLGFTYKLVPEQRYDLSNHVTWMMEGKPGGQGKYNHIFGEKVIYEYKEALKRSWRCDTIFLYMWKNS